MSESETCTPIVLSNQMLSEAQVAANSTGLSITAWIEAVCFRVARAQGIPAGVIDPAYNHDALQNREEHEGRKLVALERIAAALERSNSTRGAQLQRELIEAFTKIAGVK